LTDDARAHWQSLVDSAYDMFVGDVAKGRGVSAEQVRNGFGEGRMVAASDAVKEGMIDRVATLEQTIGRMMNPNGRSRVSGSSASVYIDRGMTAAALEPGQMENFAGPIRPTRPRRLMVRGTTAATKPGCVTTAAKRISRPRSRGRTTKQTPT
jgi:ClpP class serine protease